jgi:hypothetical protein
VSSAWSHVARMQHAESRRYVLLVQRQAVSVERHPEEDTALSAQVCCFLITECFYSMRNSDHLLHIVGGSGRMRWNIAIASQIARAK